MSSRKRIRYGVPVIPVIIFLLFLCFSFFANTFADDSNYYTIFSEGFEGDLPPEGWTLNATVDNFTWRQVDSALGGTILPAVGEYFAFVGGSSGLLYDEILITPKIELEEWHDCCIYGELVCDKTDFFIDSPFTIDISYNYDDGGFSNWKNIGYIDDGEIYCSSDQEPDPWTTFGYFPYDFSKKTFWLRFRYTGYRGKGIGLDYLIIWCDSNGWNPPDDDDDNNDNNDDNIITDDMVGNSRNADGDDKDDKGCGFAGRTFDPAAPLALFMVLIGIVSLLISKRRFHL